MGIWGFFIILSIISYIVSIIFQNKFRKYSQLAMPYGMSGAEISRSMLADYGIRDVKITVAQGFLTDHYNPATKTIALSNNNYYGRSIAAAAVAAHETGHAVQHHSGYFWVRVRSGLVPLVQIGSQFGSWLLLLGMFMLNVSPTILLLGIAGYSLTVIFSLVTLPVEIDASRRALHWLNQTGLLQGQDYIIARDALRWAAMTYVVAALTSLAVLIYYILIFLGASRDE